MLPEFYFSFHYQKDMNLL